MKKKIKLHFDVSPAMGSKEHFWHFFWGYLLPSTYEIITNEKKQSTTGTYYFESCGPVMDPVLIELLEFLDYEVSVLSKEDFRALDAESLVIERWDTFLLRNQLIKEVPSRRKFTKLIRKGPKKILSKLTYFLKNFAKKDFKEDLQEKIALVRQTVMAQVAAKCEVDAEGDQASTYLILDRSPQPDFYKENGGAEKPSYGSARRALRNVSQVVQQLRQQKIKVASYEPGSDSIIKQIQVYGNCHGIIGIKGAEFANMIWLKERAKVIQIKPTMMDSKPVQQELARLLNLDFTEIENDEGFFPDLKNINLIEHITL